MRVFLIFSALILTACGAAGPPVPPTDDATVSISGDVSVGVRTKID